MGFWQNLVFSYDKNADALKSKYPLSTTTVSNNSDIIAVIVIDGNGQFIKADKIDKKKFDKKLKEYTVPLFSVLIPVTEESMGRTSTGAWKYPHPVFDQYDYLNGEGEKFDSYLGKLKQFAESKFATPQVKAIFNYVSKKSVAADLSGIDVKDKTNIIFEVQIPGNPQTKVWEDKTFFDAWHQYYSSQKNDNQRLDYISGNEQPVAESHPKKISNGSANAKLISDNDNTNFTFRGKFHNSEEAFSLGYESSQKAHQFLRYLIDGRGFFCGEQVILSYTIGETKKLLPPLADTREEKSAFDEIEPSDRTESRTESDKEIAVSAKTGLDYSDALNKALKSYCAGNALQQHHRTAVIALDAATTGRLSITFYRELAETEYLERIAEWHEDCKWHRQFWDKEKEEYIPYIGAPSVDNIIEAVYGKPRGGQDKSYEKIKKAARERLLRCIFDGSLIPDDYISAAVHRCSNPLGLGDNDKNIRNTFEQFLAVTCALVRKFFKHQQYQLIMEHDRTDRDYLYGRLLGAADKLEQYANYKNQNDRAVTNALRYMSAFAQHPFRTWSVIHDRLTPYMQTHKGIAFDEIEAVSQLFQDGDFENDSPLNGSYLLGYYHERDEIDRLGNEVKNKQTANNQPTTNQQQTGEDQ
ncbi:MAG: type I-C CRISPR-associated protein Cas8c/Csd1 [Planctomycetaceae bacterium]|nr:type I-C CRISPR-associated protein Cas8c/Csd1 [Planctomycetaceae bacterium]